MQVFFNMFDRRFQLLPAKAQVAPMDALLEDRRHGQCRRHQRQVAGPRLILGTRQLAAGA